MAPNGINGYATNGFDEPAGNTTTTTMMSSYTGAQCIDDLLRMPTPKDTTIVEYIWIDGTMEGLRSKARSVTKPVKSAADLSKWNFDGSSTGQAAGDDSEVILVPRATFKDPFRGGHHLLCMCDCYDPMGNALVSNSRAKAAEIFSNAKVAGQVPWYGIEQEYALLDASTNWPLGWPEKGFPGPQGPYYCAIGAGKISGRDVCDAHYKACLYAGLQISGTNGEVMPSQWEYQVGPCEGISSADQMWISRYILERICELANVKLSLDPKPIPGDWNGSGAHVNYSTKDMRADGGYEVIKSAIAKLAKRHDHHIKAYGEGNERRLTGAHETASIDAFSWGVANRGASVRVGRETEADGKGYMEDRRPASNMDPYVVTSLIAETTILM
mmetsp:Transcript_4341/g.7487  ORF Transcript_4341/g.7487 Transcript_4341/m.7487 type:complete len:385 (+) Transcript_4341:208-1362(+)